MEEKILTLHPQGKKGVNISKKKYDQIAKAMLDLVKKHQAISYQLLNDLLVKQLQDKFDGSIPWYVVTVKLDLEARDILERIPKTSPHQVRLANTQTK
ncbi:MAG: hypothetical protein AB8G15_21870 [Saprospiraceae bacterium]